MLEQLKNIYKYKHLLLMFVERDIKARYAQTFMGFSWTVIQPLFLMVIFNLIFSRFLNVNSRGIPYPIFSYVALVPWFFISKSLTLGGQSFFANKGIIKKIYFPREIIPISSTLSSLIDFFISFSIFIILMFFYKIPFTFHFAYILILIPIQVILAISLSIFISPLSVIFRDLKFALPLFSQIWMYATPIIYSLNGIQKNYLSFFYLNPITGIIEGYRNAILFNQSPFTAHFYISIAFSILFLYLSLYIFRKLEGFVIDIL